MPAFLDGGEGEGKAAALVRALKTAAPVCKSDFGTCQAPVKVACDATQRGRVLLLKTVDPAQRAAPRRQARWKHYGRSYEHQEGSYEHQEGSYEHQEGSYEHQEGSYELSKPAWTKNKQTAPLQR